MSTKGLMTHKKVAEVTLNEAGKAATLTLASPWLYEGSRGPFTLTNVEHGHKIVKGAVSDGTAPAPSRSPPQRSPATTPTPGAGPVPGAVARTPGDSPFTRPHAPRGDTIIVYRLMLVPKDKETPGLSEVAGWLKTSEEYGKAELRDKTWATLRKGGTALDKIDPSAYECKSFRWTNKHQADARKAQEMGSPWGSENHG